METLSPTLFELLQLVASSHGFDVRLSPDGRSIEWVDKSTGRVVDTHPVEELSDAPALFNPS